MFSVKSVQHLRASKLDGNQMGAEQRVKLTFEIWATNSVVTFSQSSVEHLQFNPWE